MPALWVGLVGLGVGLTIAKRLVSHFFSDPVLARRELTRFPKRPSADLTDGPARITGRVVPSGPLLNAPVSGTPCVFFQLQGPTGDNTPDHAGGSRSRTSTFQHPQQPVRFEIDDGAGRALVRVPPPPPVPLPGDQLLWEIVCSIGGAGTRTTTPHQLVERIIVPGDIVSVGGHAHAELVREGERQGYRSMASRLVITTNADYRLVIVKT